MLFINLHAAARHLVTLAGGAQLVCVAAGMVGVASYLMLGPVIWQYVFLAALIGAITWILAGALIAPTSAEVPSTLRRIAICALPLSGLLIYWLAFAVVIPNSAVLSVAALSAGSAVALFIWLRVLPLPVNIVRVLRHIVSSPKTVIVLALCWAVLYSTASVLQWWNFVPQSQDLGIHEQALYNLSRGDGLTYTVDFRYPGKTMHRFADHFEPTILLLLPLYMLWQSPALLLIIQAIVVALGAIPVSHIARRFTDMPSAGLVMAAAYLMHPGLHHGLMTEFHMGVLAAPLILWGIYFAMEERIWPAVTFFVLALGCKENIAATVCVVGLYLAVRGQRRFGGGIAFLALIWGYIAVQIVIPHFSPTGQYFYGSIGGIAERLASAPGDGLSGLHAVTNRVEYVFALIGPVALLPILAPLEALIALPEFMLHMLSGHASMLVLTAHYHVTIVAGIIFAACAGLQRLMTWLARRNKQQHHLRRAFMLGLCAYVVFFWYQAMPLGLCINKPLRTAFTTEIQEKHRLISLIPDNTSVLTNQQTMANHLARRLDLTLLYSRSPLELPSQYIENAEYVLLSIDPEHLDQAQVFQARHGLQLLGKVERNFLWRRAAPGAPADS